MFAESREELLEELYFLLLSKGPGFNSQVEFWDPTSEAIVLLEELMEKTK